MSDYQKELKRVEQEQEQILKVIYNRQRLLRLMANTQDKKD